MLTRAPLLPRALVQSYCGIIFCWLEVVWGGLRVVAAEGSCIGQAPTFGMTLPRPSFSPARRLCAHATNHLAGYVLDATCHAFCYLPEMLGALVHVIHERLRALTPLSSKRHLKSARHTPSICPAVPPVSTLVLPALRCCSPNCTASSSHEAISDRSNVCFVLCSLRRKHCLLASVQL